MSKRLRRAKKHHPNWPVRWLLLGLLFSFFLSSVLIPAVRFRLETEGLQRERWELLTELMLSHSLGWFLIVWFFFFGACLGSFLNVVAYRIPHGLTILGTSRCPWCLVPIKSRHNFPILGWLMLRGRCHACRLPISPRYVLVEIVAGLVMVWLFLFELAADGGNLPGDRNYRIDALFRQLAAGDLSGIESDDWSLVRIFALHALVAYTILTAALMRLDRLPIPRFWQLIHWGIVMIWLMIWPGDFEYARAEFQLGQEWPAWFRRFDFQLTGLAVGALVGFQFQELLGDRRSGLLFAWMLIGTSCGLVATISSGFLFLIMLGLACCWPHGRRVVGQPLLIALAAMLIQIAAWRFLDRLEWWPGRASSSLVLIGFLLPGTIATIVATSVRGRGSNRQANDRSSMFARGDDELE